MKMREYIDRIEDALREDDVLETAWQLTDLGLHVLPVQCTAARRDKEKLPVYPYSSNNVLTRDNDWDDLCDAFDDERYGIALSPHIGCGLIIIDADTPEEVGALSSWWQDALGEELPDPTVITPGMQDEEGNWQHKNGGHWYVAYSPRMTKEFDPARYAKNATVEYEGSHFNVRIQGSYNILPPSRRRAGSYKLVGHITSGMVKTLDGDRLAEKFFAICEKKTPTFEPVQIENSQRFATGDGFNFPAGMSLKEKIAIWVDTRGAYDLVASTGRFAPDNTATCSQECHALHYDGSKQGRSAVVHGLGCNAAPHGTVTVFSDTLKGDINAKQDVVSVWTLVKELKYAGDTQEAIHGEGLHTPMRYGGQEWMRERFKRSA